MPLFLNYRVQEHQGTMASGFHADQALARYHAVPLTPLAHELHLPLAVVGYLRAFQMQASPIQ